MALGAMAEDPNLKVKIVPVGLSYFHPHRFRSRAVIEFGHPLDVPEELVETFKAGGEAKRKATTELLDLIYDGLKTVTVRAPDYETLMVRRHSSQVIETMFDTKWFYSTANPSSSSTLQNTRATSHPGPGCGNE